MTPLLAVLAPTPSVTDSADVRHQALAQDAADASQDSGPITHADARMNELPGDVAANDEEDPVAILQTFVSSVQHLPLFSGMAVQLIRSVDNEDIMASELSRMISTDAALVAHLLRLVNSSYYGLTRRVGTVTDACMVLGLNLIRRTVTVAVLQRPLFAYLHDTAVAREFWRHELFCAALARHLAAQKGVDAEGAYLAGLLHDVGRLVMLMEFPEQSDVLLRTRGGDTDNGLNSELLEFGFTHAQVGGALLELWGLPEGIVMSAHQHADETEPEDAMAACVWRANLLSHEMAQETNLDEEQPWMTAIGLTVAARQKIFDEIRALED
jgi:putative nucleotidyltransferase with HDIG domain